LYALCAVRVPGLQPSTPDSFYEYFDAVTCRRCLRYTLLLLLQLCCCWLLPVPISDPPTSTLVAEPVGTVLRTLVLQPKPLLCAALRSLYLPCSPSPAATVRTSYPRPGLLPSGPRGVPRPNTQRRP